MTDLENYIYSAIFFLILCGLFCLWKFRKNGKAVDVKQKFILECLELARSQFEIFNIKLNSPGEARSGLSAMLRGIGKDGLHMEVSDFVSEDWRGKPVDAYFRALRDDAPVFYVFSSVVRQVKSDYEDSHVLLALPENIRVEKKRHFMRVKPQKDDVRVIGVWPLLPGRRLPRSTNEIGTPLSHYRQGIGGDSVLVEDISASGMALRFTLDSDGKAPVNCAKGAHFLCLVVYSFEGDDNATTAFWCSCEVMNWRVAEGNPPSHILGLEFTNWAVLEQGTSEIHWVHSSPSRGARPILQWVEHIDKKRCLGKPVS